MSITQLEQPPENVAQLSVAELAKLLDLVGDARAKLALRDDCLTAALILRFGAQDKAAREAAGKSFGIVHLQPVDGYDIAVDIAKSVKWDQDLCREAIKKLIRLKLKPEDFVTTEIKINETKFKDWPARIAALFRPARTEKPRKPSFTIEPVKTDLVKDAQSIAA